MHFSNKTHKTIASYGGHIYQVFQTFEGCPKISFSDVSDTSTESSLSLQGNPHRRVLL